jgi:hypothetical protein
MLGQQYSSLTELHGCRWDVVHPLATKFNFGQCDFAVHFASQVQPGARLQGQQPASRSAHSRCSST